MKTRPRQANGRHQPEDAQDAALQDMSDEGLIRPPARKGPTPVPRWRPVKAKGKPLSETIMEDRVDRA